MCASQLMHGISVSSTKACNMTMTEAVVVAIFNSSTGQWAQGDMHTATTLSHFVWVISACVACCLFDGLQSTVCIACKTWYLSCCAQITLAALPHLLGLCLILIKVLSLNSLI